MFRRSGNYVAGQFQCNTCPFCPTPLPTIRKNTGLRNSYNTAATSTATEHADRKPPRSRATARRLALPGRKMPLGVNMLGKPGHVIVIPRPGNRSKGRLRPPKVEPKNLQGVLWRNMDEVLEEVNKSQVALSADDVIASFESLRSEHQPGENVRRHDWDELRDSLYRGFTGNQLVGYMRYLQRRGAEIPSDGKAGKMEEDVVWKPGTLVFLELKGRRQKTTTSSSAFRDIQGKMMLVETILRIFWKLSIRDEIGRLDMCIDPAVFLTLLRSKTRPLTRLKGTCGRDLDLEIWETANMVSIIGREKPCLEVRDAIDELISGVRSTEVDLSGAASALVADDHQLPEDLGDFLRYHHDVFCKREANGQKLTIYYTRDSDIENALRSIRLSTALPLDRKTGLVTYLPESQLASMYPFMAPQALPWLDRKAQWVRWAKPFPKTGISGGRLARRPPEAVYAKQKDSALPKMLEHFFQRKRGDLVYDGDHNYLRETINASVGKCLFGREPSQMTGEDARFSHFENADARAFATDVPNALSFLGGLDQITRNDSIDTCRIRLIPSPTNKWLFPPVELELDICPQNQFLEANVIPTITRASIVVDEPTIDMLLPDTTVDLRFTKTVQYDLLESPETGVTSDGTPDITSPLITKLRKCIASFPARYPLAGPQPQLPASCSLLIPERFARPRRTSDSMGEEKVGFLEAEYIVLPQGHLTASRTTRFNYKDFALEFSNPSTGPVLPQRTTHVSLFLNRDDNEIRPRNALPNRPLSSLREDGTVGSLSFAFRPFFNRACQLAFELGASHGGDTKSSTVSRQSEVDDADFDTAEDSDFDKRNRSDFQ